MPSYCFFSNQATSGCLGCPCVVLLGGCQHFRLPIRHLCCFAYSNAFGLLTRELGTVATLRFGRTGSLCSEMDLPCVEHRHSSKCGSSESGPLLYRDWAECSRAKVVRLTTLATLLGVVVWHRMRRCHPCACDGSKRPLCGC